MKTKSKFEGLTPAQRRVEIAKDVLLKLDSKKIVAKHMTYLRADRPIVSEAAYDDGQSMKMILQDIPQCRACAMGSLFVAAVDRFNEFDASRIDSNDIDDPGLDLGSLDGALRDHFDADQLQVIERAFEKWTIFDKDRKPFVWRPELKTADARMRAIAQNLIDNGGTFVL
jgi:hypothetical protein